VKVEENSELNDMKVMTVSSHLSVPNKPENEAQKAGESVPMEE